MTIISDVQKLNPGNRVVLFDLDATALGGGVVRFHGMMNNVIVWKNHEYHPWPIHADGFTLSSGQQSTPKLRVGNLNGAVSLLCLMYDDLLGAKLTRRITHAQYLDAVNFPDGNPDADPDEEYPPERWFIRRKSSENREAVEFELGSPLDFNGVQLPRRSIIANHCTFQYRGPGCAYIGPPVATIDDVPTSDPALDRCGKRLQSCQMRLWPDGILNYGGFPAASLVRI